MIRTQNSLVTSQVLGLYDSLFKDLCLQHPSHSKDILRDLHTLKERVSHEGLPFVTSFLPTFGKTVLRAVELGSWTAFQGLKTKGSLPKFLGCWLKVLFNESGRARTTQDAAQALGVIHQVCSLVYKLDLPYDKEVQVRFLENFVAVDASLKEVNPNDHILKKARRIVTAIFRGFDPYDIEPGHGPGAVATGERAYEKWLFKRKYRAIHKVYPYYSYFVPSRSALLERIGWYRGLEPRDTGVAKVRLVPKDSRGPRIISMEPLEYQFIQQGLSRAMVKWLQAHRLTRGLINFKHQSVNQKLALYASREGKFATLDLKEASDRVSLDLVQFLFGDCPTLLRALEATRTPETELPDGRIVRLRKFANMGSAVCFPVEAIVFFAICRAICEEWGYDNRVVVYGDDLIIDVKAYDLIRDYFPDYNLVLSADKCFYRGKFRESCGLDAYSGLKITPLRMKKLFPTSLKDAAKIVACADLQRRMAINGFKMTASYISSNLLKVIKLPYSMDSHLGCLALYGRSNASEFRTRWNAEYQRWEYHVWQFEKSTERSGLHDTWRLFPRLLGNTFNTVPVPLAGRVKKRWCSLV